MQAMVCAVLMEFNVINIPVYNFSLLKFLFCVIFIFIMYTFYKINKLYFLTYLYLPTLTG